MPMMAAAPASLARLKAASNTADWPIWPGDSIE